MIRRLLTRLAWWLELRKPGPDPDGDLGAAVHVVPTDDLVEHTLDGECVCGPDIEHGRLGDGRPGRMYTHHSLDGREAIERSAT